MSQQLYSAVYFISVTSSSKKLKSHRCKKELFPGVILFNVALKMSSTFGLSQPNVINLRKT